MIETARVSDGNDFKRMFAPGRLTLGVFFPIEAFEHDEPTMRNQKGLARRAPGSAATLSGDLADDRYALELEKKAIGRERINRHK